jgi:kynurenine formamidase
MNHSQTLAQLIGGIMTGGIRVIDLTVPLQATTPVIKLPPQFAPSKPFSLDEISRYDSRGPAWYWNNFTCGEHTGTHFDAPIHWVTGKDYPQNATHNIPVERFIGPACVIDVAQQARENPDFLLTSGLIEGWERQHGRIPEHAWVLIRTDWSKRVARIRRDFTRIACRFWRVNATSSAWGWRRWAPTRGRPRPSIPCFRATRSCTAQTGSAWRASPTSITCRRRVPW